MDTIEPDGSGFNDFDSPMITEEQLAGAEGRSMGRPEPKRWAAAGSQVRNAGLAAVLAAAATLGVFAVVNQDDDGGITRRQEAVDTVSPGAQSPAGALARTGGGAAADGLASPQTAAVQPEDPATADGSPADSPVPGRPEAATQARVPPGGALSAPAPTAAVPAAPAAPAPAAPAAPAPAAPAPAAPAPAPAPAPAEGAQPPPILPLAPPTPDEPEAVEPDPVVPNADTGDAPGSDNIGGALGWGGRQAWPG